MRKLLRTVSTTAKHRCLLPLSLLAVMLCILAGCSDQDVVSVPTGMQPLLLSGQIEQENITRANDFGFVGGDRMGIYVVDRVNGEAGTLGATDNRASNVLYTLDGDSYRWTSPTSIYWRDQQTAVDIYGYYPGVNYIETPMAYQFSVQTDQNSEAANGELGGYEQSDLLWGKKQDVAYTTEQIVLQYHHILSGVRVALVKGEGISDTEWQKLEKVVLVENTVLQSAVNLQTGVAALQGTAASAVCMAKQSDDHYRAVVIPQVVAAGKKLISVTLDGKAYSHSLSIAMSYQAGKLHNFTLTVNKGASAGDYQLSLAYDGITPWLNDENSHQFSANAYVVVNCPETGQLEESIRAAGYDPQTLQNLKVTGELTDADFKLLREGMPELRNLNLKDVKVKHTYHSYWKDNYTTQVEYYSDNELPDEAFYRNKTIHSLILPSSIKRIGRQSLYDMGLMYSTLEVPEGVTYIGEGAFSNDGYNSVGSNDGVELILPNTLDTIADRAFQFCHYNCELNLTDNISYIGKEAFGGWQYEGCLNFHGVFHIPSKLKTLSFGMFEGLGGNGMFTGEIEFPQGITEIPDQMFGISATGMVLCKSNFQNRMAITIPSGVKRIGNSAFTGMRLASLALPNDVETIGIDAFYDAQMPFALTLPQRLKSLGNRAFADCGLEGELVVPDNCLVMGDGTFARNDFTKVTLPSHLEYISKELFASNPRLQEVIIPKYVDQIDNDAFAACNALQTVVCLNPEPPELGTNVFGEVEYDKCVLQVPEQSVEAYRSSEGWKQFQNITPYRELAFNIPEIQTLDKGSTLQGIIRAEGEWEVADCPSWVTVSPSSGTGKAELTITVDANSGDSREGQITFSLKNKSYTTFTTVKQLAYEYKEDETIVLQRASAGAAHEIPLFIVGEGYRAEDIVSGKYLEEVKQQVEYLFSCEPYKTYRNYFTVSTAIAVSPEEGVELRTRFGTKFDITFYVDEEAKQNVWHYAENYGVGVRNNHSRTTVVMLVNSDLTCNTTVLEDDGYALAVIGKSQDSYPFDQRGYVLHDVGGIAFGKLATEDVVHFTFAKSCTCGGCLCWACYWNYKSKGWFENISQSGKMNEVPWAHLVFHPQYSQYVDVYEGGYRHARGFYRSENMSVMGNTYIPYYNTISRESIVKRIMNYAGETYTFEKFVVKDKREYPE